MKQSRFASRRWLDAFLRRRSFPQRCIMWPFAKTVGGYGAFSRIGAHRYVWQKHYDAKAGDRDVRHTCDNRACVNPRHLVLGTRKDNLQDMVARGRSLRGERSHFAKLTDEAARAIRAAREAGESGSSLAARFSVSQATVCMIYKRNTWRHVA